MKLKPLTLAVVLALGGCTMIPGYERPAAPVDADWPKGVAYADQQIQGPVAADIGWQEVFHDPALQRLIGQALENNRDLRQAALTVEAYRAQYRIQRSELIPSISTDYQSTRQRIPSNGTSYGSSGSNSQPYIYSRYSLTVGVTSYELDVFGRIRSLTRQALENYLATEETRRSVHISLVSDVATTYFTLRTNQAQLSLTQATLQSYRHSLSMVEASAEVGTGSDLDVHQARTLVDQASAQEALYTRNIAENRNALQLLLGSSLPTDLPTGIPPNKEALAEVPPGLPADLLLRRPDIRAAEHQLRAANANIGAARAAFFPRITLTAAAGTLSADLSDLFSAGTWTFAPQISVPIFTGGRLRADLDYAKIQKDINIASYEKAIQTAFREVADGLAARGTFGRQLQAQGNLVENYRAYYQLAQQRYDEGVDDYLSVLDSQRQLFAAQQQLLSDRLLQLNAEVSLYKALGGGWHRTSVSQTDSGSTADPS